MHQEVVRILMRASGASIELEALSGLRDGDFSYRNISSYKSEGLFNLTTCIEMLKTTRPFEELVRFGNSIENSFERLHQRAMACCARLHCRGNHLFLRTGKAIKALFCRAECVRDTVRSALARRELNDEIYWNAVLDRLLDMISLAFKWLRDLLLAEEKLNQQALGCIKLGEHCRKFVERADRSENTLVIVAADGRRELFNMTPAAWNLLMPLLTSTDPNGYAKLSDRPRSALMRHDSDGDSTENGMSRLSEYIHAVGRGRGGKGLYYLAPYTRSQACRI